mgnify:CR=1 FL=1
MAKSGKTSQRKVSGKASAAKASGKASKSKAIKKAPSQKSSPTKSSPSKKGIKWAAPYDKKIQMYKTQADYFARNSKYASM